MVAVPRGPDPDLHRPPPVRRLAIDWSTVSLASEADALALWQQIAPTGADWDDKLLEVPASAARPLAVALLRGGNFACAAPQPADCGKPVLDVAPPADTAGFGDPCLRRVLALWAISQLEDDDLPGVFAALRAIVAIPPPESQLVDAAIHAIPPNDHAARLELLAIAWRAGQRELVDAAVGPLDEPALIEAVRRHHIGGALEVLSPLAHRSVYLAAITDEAMPARARTTAITELAADAAQSGALPPDLRTALVTATKAKDCSIAAVAARTLVQRGESRFLPNRPHTRSAAAMLRAVCVLASYEALQASDEPSLLAGYLPAQGLERVIITYDPLSDTDDDGDGDPHTVHSQELVPRADAVLPEVDALVRTLRHCTGAICVSDEHEARFVWRMQRGELVLSRIELADRPPCTPGNVTKPPRPDPAP